MSLLKTAFPIGVFLSLIGAARPMLAAGPLETQPQITVPAVAVQTEGDLPIDVWAEQAGAESMRLESRADGEYLILDAAMFADEEPFLPTEGFHEATCVPTEGFVEGAYPGCEGECYSSGRLKPWSRFRLYLEDKMYRVRMKNFEQGAAFEECFLGTPGCCGECCNPEGCASVVSCKPLVRYFQCLTYRYRTNNLKRSRGMNGESTYLPSPPLEDPGFGYYATSWQPFPCPGPPGEPAPMSYPVETPYLPPAPVEPPAPLITPPARMPPTLPPDKPAAPYEEPALPTTPPANP